MVNYFFVMIICLWAQVLGGDGPKQERGVFEGKVVYQLTKFHPNGEQVEEVALSEFEELYGPSIFMLKPLKGSFIDQRELGYLIVDTEEQKRFVIKHSLRTVDVYGPILEADNYVPEIRRTNESLMILGYKCYKFEIRQMSNYDDREMNINVWVTDAFDVPQLPGIARILGYQNTHILDGSLGGLVLKAEVSNAFYGTTITEAIQVSPTKLNPKEYALPKDYTYYEGEN